MKKAYFIISLISIVVLMLYLIGASIDVYVKKSVLGFSGIAFLASAIFIIIIFVLTFIFKIKFFYKVIMGIGVIDVIATYLCGFVFFQQINAKTNAMIVVSMVSYIGAIALFLNFAFITTEIIRTRKKIE